MQPCRRRAHAGAGQCFLYPHDAPGSWRATSRWASGRSTLQSLQSAAELGLHHRASYNSSAAVGQLRHVAELQVGPSSGHTELKTNMALMRSEILDLCKDFKVTGTSFGEMEQMRPPCPHGGRDATGWPYHRPLKSERDYGIFHIGGCTSAAAQPMADLGRVLNPLSSK